MVMHQIDVDKFGSLTAYNEYNDAVQLSTLWQKEPAVLVFVRHLG